MAVKSKEIINDDGTKETIVLSSNDDKKLNLKGPYVLANHDKKKESKLAQKFKGTIFGADIGVKSGGFTNIAILATVIAVSAILIMYFLWRF